jgi:hypothetical protein
MASEFQRIFDKLDTDHNGALSSSEIKVALNDPAFANHSQLLNFLDKDYNALAGVSGGQDASLGISPDDMKYLPTVLDPDRSEHSAMWSGAGGSIGGALGGGLLGTLGTELATVEGFAEGGFFSIPIGSASLPVVLGVTALAAFGGAVALGNLNYKSTIDHYTQTRNQVYPDI